MGLKNTFDNCFDDRKILITGHTGFIGSWLAIWLNELGANVIGYSLPPLTKEDNFIVTNLEKKINSNIGDIRNYEELSKIFKKSQPEIVLHLAAQPIVRRSFVFPKETYDTNIGGTTNVFEAFRKNVSEGILINFTSDKCYENQEWARGYNEDDRLGGHDPYSSSKACSEIITSAYRRSFFNNQKNNVGIASVRCGNIIGGGDWQKDRLIPDCIRAIRENQNILIRNPLSIRPWQFVLEPLYGLLLLAKCLIEDKIRYSGAWNFGPSQDIKFSVEDIVSKVIKYIGKGTYECVTNKNNEVYHETKFLLLDCSKSFKNLGWKTLLSFDEIISYTCDWYLKDDISYDFDVKQIKDYMNKID